MTVTPEQGARETVDALLVAAGWCLQDLADFNRNAAERVAVREFQLEGVRYSARLPVAHAALDTAGLRECQVDAASKRDRQKSKQAA